MSGEFHAESDGQIPLVSELLESGVHLICSDNEPPNAKKAKKIRYALLPCSGLGVSAGAENNKQRSV